VRLQLIAAICAARLAHADGDATGTLRVYADDDHVTVVSPSARAQLDAGARLHLDTGVAVDAVTGASVDVITSASPATIHERRIEGTVDATAQVTRTATAGARVIASHENDYDALHAAVHGAVELAKRNTTLAATFDEGFERATSVIDSTFHGARRTHRGVVTLTQIVDRRTYVDLVLDLSLARGYHASPYRSVIVEDPGSSAIMRVPEVTPRLREAAAMGVRVRRAVGDRSAVHAGYRFYLDDWDLHSHTATLDALTERPGGTRLGAGLRGYIQDAAAFYRERYTGAVPALRTHDRTLGAMATAEVHATLDVPVGETRIVASVGMLRMWFFDFAPQRERTALTTTLGVERPF
jgi:hypothetical protein